MLERMVEADAVDLRGVVGLFPCQADGDDIRIFDPRADDPAAGDPVTTVHSLRQQFDKGERANLALADFVAPADIGIVDWIGGFAVTAGRGTETLARALENAHDDYGAILVKALADRLAEAFAEFLHARVRREVWGYAPDETLAGQELIAESYRGIRPAPGYPACPDHTEKETLFRLLDVQRSIGVELTESFAMSPAASVSGWYFAHPEASYFGVGRIGRDQVEDYARRKRWTVAEAERWLGPHLGYTPSEDR